MKKYFLLFILSVVIFFLHAVLVRHAVYGDGNGYYSYTHALYFEKGLNFDYIYNHLGNFSGKSGVFSRIFWNKEPISDGLIRQNPFTIGTGIVWLPSMALVSLVSIFLNLGLDKYSLIYELGPGISGIFFMLSGLYFLEKYLVNFFSKRSVFWTVLTLFFATNVFYYTAFEPALSHQPAFFLISFLLFWTYRFKGSLKNFFILGALAGLLVIVRMADAIVLVPVFFQVVRVRLDYKKVFMFLLGFTLLLTPQLLTQKLMYGYFFVNPYFSGQNGFWNISFSHFIEYLFSPKRGLFAWSPVFIPAVWGLFQKRSYVFLFTVFLLWIVTSSWSAYLSAGFGQRFSFAAIPLMAFGLAYSFEKFSLKTTKVVFAVFVFLNINLISTFYLQKADLIKNDSLSMGRFIQLQIKNPKEIWNLLVK